MYFSNKLEKKIKIGGLLATVAIGCLFLTGYFGFNNRVADRGYRPEQPVPFSHKLHAGDLEISCMYCHTGVEQSSHSPVPSTSTCMNCHSVVKSDSPKIKLVKDSYENNTPIEWKRIHYLPGYAHFNHSRHIRAMIDCASCHGQVETMGVVHQEKRLSMGWCLDCHRNPEQYIVPARPISGIFTGIDSNYAVNKETGKYKLAVSRPITNPQFGQYETDVPKPIVVGIPTPKHAGFGPENCSACHH